MEIITQVCDGYIVTIVDGKVFSVKPLPQPEKPKKETPEEEQPIELQEILKNVQETRDSIKKELEETRKRWGYGSHWYG